MFFPESRGVTSEYLAPSQPQGIGAPLPLMTHRPFSSTTQCWILQSLDLSPIGTISSLRERTPSPLAPIELETHREPEKFAWIWTIKLR